MVARWRYRAFAIGLIVVGVGILTFAVILLITAPKPTL